MEGFAPRFARTYPAVELEMDVDDRFVDLVSEGYNVAVRANPVPERTSSGGGCCTPKAY